MKPLDQGTTELTKRYKKMTPGQKTLNIIKTVVSETFGSTRRLSGARPRRPTKTVGNRATPVKVKSVGLKRTGMQHKPTPGGLKGSTAQAEKGKRRGMTLAARGANIPRAAATQTVNLTRSSERLGQIARKVSQTASRIRRNIRLG